LIFFICCFYPIFDTNIERVKPISRKKINLKFNKLCFDWSNLISISNSNLIRALCAYHTNDWRLRLCLFLHQKEAGSCIQTQTQSSIVSVIQVLCRITKINHVLYPFLPVYINFNHGLTYFLSFFSFKN